MVNSINRFNVLTILISQVQNPHQDSSHTPTHRKKANRWYFTFRRRPKYQGRKTLSKHAPVGRLYLFALFLLQKQISAPTQQSTSKLRQKKNASIFRGATFHLSYDTERPSIIASRVWTSRASFRLKCREAVWSDLRMCEVSISIHSGTWGFCNFLDGI